MTIYNIKKNQLKNLAETTGIELPAEMVFTHPTAALIAEYINSLLLDHAKEDRDRQTRAASIASIVG